MSRLVIGALGGSLAAWLFALVLLGVVLVGVLLWLWEDDGRLRDLRCLRDEVEVPSWAHVAPEQIAEVAEAGGGPGAASPRSGGVINTNVQSVRRTG